MKYLLYLKYLLRHKWFVSIECWKRGLYFLGLIHDFSKFLPSEFFPYVRFFHGEDATQEARESRYQSINHAQRYFQRAWQLHLMRNQHHWQNWMNFQDEGTRIILEMPKKYAVEMVCDWIGAGRAQGYYNCNKPMEEVNAWYKKNKNRIILHPNTRDFIETLLKIKYK